MISRRSRLGTERGGLTLAAALAGGDFTTVSSRSPQRSTRGFTIQTSSPAGKERSTVATTGSRVETAALVHRRWFLPEGRYRYALEFPYALGAPPVKDEHQHFVDLLAFILRI